MSVWLRGATAVALATVSTLVATTTAHAQSPAQAADKLNEEGKDAYKGRRFDEAVNKFRQAIVLDPQGKYYFNLCVALDRTQRPDDAIAACQQVTTGNSDQDVVDKATTRIQEIKTRLAAANAAAGRDGTGDGTDGTGDGTDGTGDGTDGTGDGTDGTGDGTDGTGDGTDGASRPNPHYVPPPDEPVVEKPAAENYRWSFGFAMGPLFNQSVGSVNDMDLYSKSGVQLRGRTDFILNESRRLGVQGYVHYSDIRSDSELSDERMGIIDLGAAIFHHRRLAGDFWWTPLGGAQLSWFQPAGLDDSGDSFLTVGFRGELSLQWLLGTRKQHVITLTPLSFNLYLPAVQENNSMLPAEAFGLDQVSATFSITIGYTHRLAQPFGRGPIFILE